MKGMGTMNKKKVLSRQHTQIKTQFQTKFKENLQMKMKTMMNQSEIKILAASSNSKASIQMSDNTSINMPVKKPARRRGTVVNNNLL